MTKPALATPEPITLTDCFNINPERFNRVAVIKQAGLQVLHLSLAPGQALPRHNHPGHHVILQGLAGRISVKSDDGETVLEPGQILYLAGEGYVSPGNDGEAPAALLITLAKQSQA